MHISSLPSDYGIGTLGKEAYAFVDFLKEAGQSYWQILPICPTGYGDSPYQSFSCRAGNPYFIDFETLCGDGLLEKEDFTQIQWGDRADRVDYENLYHNRFTVLKKAFERFKQTDLTEFHRFLEKNDNWISNYGLFMSLKEEFNGKPWTEWDEGVKKRDPHALWMFKSEHEEDVMFWEFIQFEFYRQWFQLKQYANKNGVQIIGDIPIYVAPDSADVWVYPDLFDLDEETLLPQCVAGCPPDAFSETGQLWGNPVYDWARHKETDYNWWVDRLRSSLECFDWVRIDHFRGFAGYYAIPYGDKTAENGVWKTGPGIDFFDFLKSKFSELPIIAENLGFLTEDVHTMLRETGFPGMKVLEFAFNPDEPSSYLPHNYDKNCVAYTGTHDNDTLIGWKLSLDQRTLDYCKKYMRIATDNNEKFSWEFIKGMFASSADTAIVQMQDYLMLDGSARMNIPSTDSGNWVWRASKKSFTKKLAKQIYDITDTYVRLP